jgi:hypothetical protein
MSIVSVRTTAGSVLGTVTSAADAVGSVFGAASRGISMLDKYVADAQSNQTLRSVVDRDTFTQVLAEEKAMEEAVRKIQVLEFTNKSTDHKDLYSTAYDRIQALIAAQTKT